MSSITVQTQDGERVFAGYSELHAALWSLQQVVNQTNLARARAYFALGELLVKSYEQIKVIDPTITKKRIYTDANLHPQKAKRSIKWYEALRDDDGSFSEQKFSDSAHEVAQAIGRGEMRGALDEHGTPSVYSIQRHLGHRGSAATAGRLTGRSDGRSEDVQSRAVPFDQDDDDDGFSVMDVINQLPSPTDDEIDEHEHADPPPAAHSAHRLVKPSVNPGASGAQMTIDFDLIARERELRTSIQIVAARLAAGTLDTAHAAGIDQRMQKLTKYINDTIEEAVA